MTTPRLSLVSSWLWESTYGEAHIPCVHNNQPKAGTGSQRKCPHLTAVCCGCNLQWEGREEKPPDSLPTHTSQDIIHPSKQDTESKSPITFLVKRWQKAQNGSRTLLEGWGEAPTEEKPLLSFQVSCISFQGHIWNNLEHQTPWKFTAHDNLK